MSIIKNNGQLKVNYFRHLRVSFKLCFQESQKTVKITEINHVEDFAFTQYTSFLLQFILFVLFQYEAFLKNEIKR